MDIVKFCYVASVFHTATGTLLLSLPNNVAVYEGDTVTLTCYVKDPVKNPRWFRHSIDRENKIYTGIQVALPDLYDVNTSLPGQFDLIIKSAAMGLAGKYICNINTTLSGAAEVVVLAHRPRCISHSIIVYSSKSSTPHLENIFMIELNASCEVTFRGNLIPIMEWRSGNTSDPLTEGVNSTITEHHNLTSMVMTTVHSSELPRITCTTKFEKGITGPGGATNVPSLVFNWNLPLESSESTMYMFPSNVAVYEGDTVTLMCSGRGLRKNPRWFRSNLDRVNKIFTGDQIVYPDLYAVNKSLPGQFDLVIKSITLAMAGKYICSLDPEIAVSAEVVVLADMPVCGKSVVNTRGSSNRDRSHTIKVLNAWCYVSFRGNLSPTMEWMESNHSEVLTDGVKTDVVENNSVRSTLIMSLSFNELPHIMCTTKFIQDPTFSPGCASNLPSYVFTWNLPILSDNDIKMYSVDDGNTLAKYEKGHTNLIVGTLPPSILFLACLVIYVVHRKLQAQPPKCQQTDQQSLPMNDTAPIDVNNDMLTGYAEIGDIPGTLEARKYSRICNRQTENCPAKYSNIDIETRLPLYENENFADVVMTKEVPMIMYENATQAGNDPIFASNQE